MGSALKDIGSTVEDALPLIGAGAGAMVGGPAGASLGMGLGSALEGTIGGIQSGNQAQSYERQQQAALQADAAARQQFLQRENTLYGPMRQQMFQEAASPYPLNYGPAAGNINAQTLGAQQRMSGVMASHGMGGSGLEAAGLQGLETGRVGELSQAFQRGMQARTQLGMNLLQGYNPTQQAQFGQGGLPYQMQFGGAQQGIYNKGMEQGMGAIGPGLAGALDAYKGMQKAQQQQPFNWGGDQVSTTPGTATMGQTNFLQNYGQSPGLQLSTVEPGAALPGMGAEMPMAQATQVPDMSNGLGLWDPFSMATTAAGT